MEQTKQDYYRLMVLRDEKLAQVKAASVTDAVQILAPMIFNARAFEVKDH